MLMIGGILMLTLFGCGGGNRFRVDYNGRKDAFRGAKDTYRAGQQVTLYYDLIGTDTDYAFFLDGERLQTDYSHQKGYILRFTMPDRDVTLTVESYNSMVFVPPEETVDLPEE